MKRILSAFVFFVVVAAASSASALSISLSSTQTASVNTVTGNDEWNDGYVRAYVFSPNYIIDSWMKFDFSALPDNAQITSMNLTLYTDGGFGLPITHIARSTLDSWATGGSGFPTTYAENLTAPAVGPYPAIYSQGLNVGAVDWSADLLDNALSLVLVMDQETGYAAAYFKGAYAGDFAPKLDINYELAQTPLPAALPLFASVLGLFGAARWRRKFAVLRHRHFGRLIAA